MELDCCGFFKAVSDPTRVRIMKLLIGKEMWQPSISHHLNILKNAKIVKSRKEGKEVYYSLDRFCISDCCGSFMKDFEE